MCNLFTFPLQAVMIPSSSGESCFQNRLIVLFFLVLYEAIGQQWNDIKFLTTAKNNIAFEENFKYLYYFRWRQTKAARWGLQLLWCNCRVLFTDYMHPPLVLFKGESQGMSEGSGHLLHQRWIVPLSQPPTQPPLKTWMYRRGAGGGGLVGTGDCSGIVKFWVVFPNY